MKAFAVTEAASCLPYCSRDPCLKTVIYFQFLTKIPALGRKKFFRLAAPGIFRAGAPKNKTARVAAAFSVSNYSTAIFCFKAYSKNFLTIFLYRFHVQKIAVLMQKKGAVRRGKFAPPHGAFTRYLIVTHNQIISPSFVRILPSRTSAAI